MKPGWRESWHYHWLVLLSKVEQLEYFNRNHLREEVENVEVNMRGCRWLEEALRGGLREGDAECRWIIALRAFFQRPLSDIAYTHTSTKTLI